MFIAAVQNSLILCSSRCAELAIKVRAKFA